MNPFRLLNKKRWLPPALIAVSIVVMSYSAWNGDRFAVLVVAFFSVLLCILYAFAANLVDSTLETSHEALAGWKKETEYASAITNDNVAMIQLLLEHDPEKAQHYQERLSKAVANRYPSALTERQSKAKMN